MLQLKPNEKLFYKSGCSVRYFAHLCWPCLNDTHSRNGKYVVAEQGPDKNRFNTEMEALYYLN